MVVEATEIIGKAELMAAFGVLGTVIVVLWGVVYHTHKQNIQRAEKYEALHHDSQKENKKIHGDYRELKGEINGITKLSESVLREIRSIKQND